jgi:hypothetical protein
MNEAMKSAWLEITEMLGEPTPEELDVFLRAWQRAILAEREACAKVCETYDKRQCYNDEDMAVAKECADAIRARGNT